MYLDDIICAAIHEEFNKINRLWIAHIEQEIGVIIRTSVFCVDKTCFPRPDHILILKPVVSYSTSPFILQ